MPQGIVSGEDLLQLIWSMAKFACKEADLPAELQRTTMSADSMKKLTHACILNGLLDDVFSCGSSETVAGPVDALIALLKRSLSSPLRT